MFTSHEPFQLQPTERDRLEQMLRTTSLSAGLVRRARVLLLLADVEEASRNGLIP